MLPWDVQTNDEDTGLDVTIQPYKKLEDGSEQMFASLFSAQVKSTHQTRCKNLDGTLSYSFTRKHLDLWQELGQHIILLVYYEPERRFYHRWVENNLGKDKTTKSLNLNIKFTHSFSYEDVKSFQLDVIKYLVPPEVVKSYINSSSNQLHVELKIMGPRNVERDLLPVMKAEVGKLMAQKKIAEVEKERLKNPTKSLELLPDLVFQYVRLGEIHSVVRILDLILEFSDDDNALVLRNHINAMLQDGQKNNDIQNSIGMTQTMVWPKFFVKNSEVSLGIQNQRGETRFFLLSENNEALSFYNEHTNPFNNEKIKFCFPSLFYQLPYQQQIALINSFRVHIYSALGIVPDIILKSFLEKTTIRLEIDNAADSR